VETFAEFVVQGIELILTPGEAVDVGATADEGTGNRRAEAAAGPGDGGHFIR
jgi:hypothetical protein